MWAQSEPGGNQPSHKLAPGWGNRRRKKRGLGNLKAGGAADKEQAGWGDAS